MLNPLSQDLGVMRQSILFSGLEALAHNINRKRDSLKLFEFGKTYHQYSEERKELKHLGLFLTGKKDEERWNGSTNAIDFFHLKGSVEAILQRLGIASYQTTEAKSDVFSEAISLQLGKQKLVQLGLLKKTLTKSFGIDQSVLFADFNWDAILSLVQNKDIKFKPLPKYPAVRRDFALLLDKQIEFKAIAEIARKTEKVLLKDVSLFDVYEGENLPKGKKSYAVSFMLQDERKTLTDKQVDKVMNKLQRNFERELGAQLR